MLKPLYAFTIYHYRKDRRINITRPTARKKHARARARKPRVRAIADVTAEPLENRNRW